MINTGPILRKVTFPCFMIRKQVHVYRSNSRTSGVPVLGDCHWLSTVVTWPRACWAFVGVPGDRQSPFANCLSGCAEVARVVRSCTDL